MFKDRLFKALCNPETLKVGWHLAHLDSRDDFISDPIGYEDVATNLSARLSFLIREVRHERYRPRYLINIDLPKIGLGVRPGTVIPIEEAALLHAIIYLLSPFIDKRLSDSVYSFRLHKDWKKRVAKGRDIFHEGDDQIPFLRGTTIRKLDVHEPWYIAWPEFNQERIKAAKDRGYKYLTRTDIAAYFENIDLGLLEVQLRAFFPKETIIISLLMRILESWTRITHTRIPVGRGIPQGNNVSSFLGNVYLIPLDRILDRYCKRKGSIWLRYVDDVEVYSKDYNTARDAIYIINDALRSLLLNLQGSKTEIISGDKLDEETSREDMDTIEEAWGIIDKIDTTKKVNSKLVTATLRNLRPLTKIFRSGLPNSVYHLGSKDSRVLRRLMTVYGRCQRSYLKDVALAALSEPPELRMLNKTLRYLQQQNYQYHDEIWDKLIQLLEGDVFQLPYHAASVLESLRWFHPDLKKLKIISRIITIAQRRRKEWTVRQKALELLSTLPCTESAAYKHALNSLKHDHPFVRRAALVLLTRSKIQHVRDTIEKLIFDPDPGIARLSIFWNRYINEKQAAMDDINRYRKSKINDRMFVWQIPKLWLFRCCQHKDILNALRGYLQMYGKSKSKKVHWHINRLMEDTEWATK